jgi:hypothetical protein
MHQDASPDGHVLPRRPLVCQDRESAWNSATWIAFGRLVETRISLDHQKLALYDGYLLENVRKIIYQWELKMGIE